MRSNTNHNVDIHNNKTIKLPYIT